MLHAVSIRSIPSLFGSLGGSYVVSIQHQIPTNTQHIKSKCWHSVLERISEEEQLTHCGCIPRLENSIYLSKLVIPKSFVLIAVHGFALRN
jgi:hypothetical protein